MKYYKVILIFFIFFSIYSKSYAKDAEKLEIEFEQTKKIQIKGITKFVIVDPTIAKVQLLEDTLRITGIKFGSTPLFIWKNGEILPYVIYSVAPKDIVKYNNNQITYNIDYSKPYGYYNLFTVLSQSGKNSNQNLVHQLYYKLPFYNGFLAFNGGFNNAFMDIKNLQNLDINNIQLMFNNKDFSLVVGDISNQSVSNLAQLRGVQMKGGSFRYSWDKSAIGFFAGVESLPLSFYNKNYVPKNNDKSGGLYANISPLNNLSLSANYTLRVRGDNNLTEPNLVGSVRWSPINSLFVSTDLGTDFKGKIAYNINSSFYYNWAKTKEYLRISALANHFDRSYAYSYNPDRSNYLTNIFFQHRSGINLNASIGRFDQSGVANNSGSIRASKIFEKYYNISSEIAYNNSPSDTNTRYSIGAEITNFIPININYSYAQGLRGGLFNENFLSGSINLFENDSLRNILSTSVRFNNSNIQNTDVASLLANVNLGLYYSGIKKINLSTAISYGRYIPNFKQSFLNNSYSLNLAGTWDASVFHRVNLSIGITKDDINDFNLFSNIGYNYSFGKAIDDAYTVGDIKGIIFEDENYNNILDENEKIVPNIKLKIADKSVLSDYKGYSITGIDYGTYEVDIDKDSLPNGYRSSSNVIETIVLSSKIKEYNIPIKYQSVIKGYIYAGKETAKGLSDIKILIDNQDSIVTDSEGYFYTTVKPGKHNLKIDYSTIPSGYTFNQSLNKEVETTKEDTEINFVFNPVRVIKIQAYETPSLNQNYSQGMKVIKDLEVNLTYPDGKFETIKTDEDGLINLEELQTGIIEISSKSLKESIKVEVPEDKFQKDIYIPVVVKVKN